MSDHAFATRAIHAGQAPDPVTGAIIPPIYQSSTHVQDSVGGLRSGYEYNRAGNPTRSSLETQVAALEGGASALSFASGLAAEDALLRGILKPGDHVLLGNDVYGGTYRLLTRVLAPWGIETTTVELSDVDVLRAAIRPETKIVWLETPSNPLLKIVDIALIAEIAHEAGVLVVVDNTFASPALQQPLALGADLVVHSTTKYLGGHSDVLGGAVVFADDRFFDQVKFQQFAVGAVSAPLDAWLTTRGIKTLALRMRQHSENAQAIAEWAQARPEFAQVYFPGLESHPGHEIAAKQMSGFGGMLSFGLAAGADAARAFAESTSIFQLAESLGGVESLIGYPPDMTHASVRGTELAVPENIVRLSVGIEDIGDLIADLEQGLDRIAR
ncbi:MULTISPECIES: cystathionine gamma-synthase [unclassified Microbacterium]|jgi:cystathionine gamma-synthase|uniref:cystathionine gamma-synthase n=1 Tax=unclassified Microbacterium TaxID=2609290 RepID=UPI00041DC569|nr:MULTISPECIES: cystathionine gamma-synthase [unclassified Microbacterium]PQZ52266.1 cystathionine gamma-synthase [Microbacterium sp. MYb43]PQZ73488.1 cystathionine gamma-synthase [Microbacterium sp. MYb40]PRB16124.1 cystathionine gamma-synthase [Microbacterium sp. MYb54]PRB22565.1 cystathionine gamma-synthase [Microbacterium sp. MYb50]PRB60741.1 cystathionine gamma-synthase [Microbacterium sp. MYb24]